MICGRCCFRRVARGGRLGALARCTRRMGWMDGMDGWGVRRSDGFRSGQGCLGFWGLGVAALGNMEGCAWRWMAKTSLGTLFLAPLSVVQYLHYTIRRCHAMSCQRRMRCGSSPMSRVTVMIRSNNNISQQGGGSEIHDVVILKQSIRGSDVFAECHWIFSMPPYSEISTE